MTARLDARHAWVAGGVLAIVGGTLAGWNGTLVTALATPPALIRAALVGAMVLVALRLLAEAIARIETGRHVAPGEMGGRDMAQLIRGVRFVFLAVAAVSAAAGWLLGSPVPLIVGLLIAGVDVIETGFLLLVVSLRGEDSAA
jgi:hypothetical protein